MDIAIVQEMANYLNKVASISLITFLILEIVFYNV